MEIWQSMIDFFLFFNISYVFLGLIDNLAGRIGRITSIRHEPIHVMLIDFGQSNKV